MNKTNRQVLRRNTQAAIWDQIKRIFFETVLREVSSLATNQTKTRTTKVSSHKRNRSGGKSKVTSHTRTTRTKAKPTQRTARRTGSRPSDRTLTQRVGSWLWAKATDKALSVFSATIRHKIKQTIAALAVVVALVVGLLAWFGWQDLTDTDTNTTAAVVVGVEL